MAKGKMPPFLAGAKAAVPPGGGPPVASKKGVAVKVPPKKGK